EIWRAVLQVEHVAREDDFFALGGDSISSILVVSRARKLGLACSPRDLFERPTLAELAARVAELGAQGGAPLAVAEGEGRVPLTPIQRWFALQGLARPDHFNQALLLALPARRDAAVLAGCLRELARHHGALRLRLDAVSGEQRHVPPEAADWPLELVNLQGC